MKRLHITYLILLLLTLSTAALVQWAPPIKLMPWLIMAVAATKFMLVILYFMDMRHAHPFWKGIMGAIALFLVIICGVFIK